MMGQSTMIIYTLLNHPKFLLAEIPSFQGQELYNPFPNIYTNQIVPNMSNFRIETWFLAGVYRKGETIIVFGQTNWFLNIHASTNPIVVLLSFKMNMMIVIILYVHKILRDIVLFDVKSFILQPFFFFHCPSLFLTPPSKAVQHPFPMLGSPGMQPSCRCRSVQSTSCPGLTRRRNGGTNGRKSQRLANLDK